MGRHRYLDRVTWRQVHAQEPAGGPAREGGAGWQAPLDGGQGEERGVGEAAPGVDRGCQAAPVRPLELARCQAGPGGFSESEGSVGEFGRDQCHAGSIEAAACIENRGC